MVRERKTKVAERVISLLLAAVMAVSGTGFTALAADIVPDETVSEVETVPSEESAGADIPEEHDPDNSEDDTDSDDEALLNPDVSGDGEDAEDAADAADADHAGDTADTEDAANAEGDANTADAQDAENAENTDAVEDEENVPDEQMPQGDPTADVESEADWKAMFSGVTRTENYAADLLAVAQTQIGYTESTANFTVIDGQSCGYTRYGAWYGMPYSEWCAEFVSFCLNYAGIPASKMPREAKCTRWITALESAGRYEAACTYHKLAVEESKVEETTDKYYIEYVYSNNQLTGYNKYYLPSAGDLIFFDYEQDGDSDHVGIVKEVVYDSEGKPIRIVTIEGNVGNAVKERSYDFTDSTILGYGILPVNMPAQSFEKTCGDVTVSVSAPEGALPAASKMEVTEAASEDVLAKLPAELRDSITSIVAVDVSFHDASGDEIEPETALHVSFRSDAIAEIEEPSLIHVSDEGELSYCAILDGGAENKGTITFESQDFSVYAVVGAATKIAEIAESENEPLLSDNELTGTTRRLLGMNPAALQMNSEGPVTVDGQTIESIAIKWLTSSTGSDTAAGTDVLELAPTTDAVGNQQFQFNFGITGENDHEAGDVEIVLPAYIWKDRDGNEMGSLTLGIPEYPNDSQSFAWRREGDYIVITNTRTLSATSKVMIQGTFRDVVAHEVVSDQESSPLWAEITLISSSGNAVSLASNTIKAKAHTAAEAASATKSALNASTGEYYAWVTSVPSSIPESFLGVLPAGTDREDYCYVRWYVTGTAVGNQLYSMELTDTASEEDGGIMLGIQTANGGAYPSADGGRSATARLLTDDFREVSAGSTGQLAQSAYVWTAYPKSGMEEGTIYTFHNTATIRVTGTDSGETTSKSASAQVQVKTPTTYTFNKEWDDDDNVRGRRPENLYIYIYRDGKQWKKVKLNEEGGWSYSWSDEGIDYVYDVYERLEIGRYVKSPDLHELMRSADSITHGLANVYYDASGVEYPVTWWYHLQESEYDTNTHTWTYTNKYREGTVPEDYGLTKTATSYTDSKETSTSDRAVKELLRGESVLVTYDISSTITSMMYGPHENEDITMALSDTGWLLRNERTGLETTDGVELTYVTLTPQSNYTYSETGEKDDEGRDYYSRSDADHAGTSELYALIGDSSEWQMLATYDGTTVKLQDGFTDLTVNGATVYLPEGTAQVKVVAKTDKDSLTVSYSVGLTVRPTGSGNGGQRLRVAPAV